MKNERTKLNESNNAEELLEFIRTARTLKRQIRLMRGIGLELEETDSIKLVLTDLKNEFALFRV